jgi:uncharacterized HAD superfamily protein
LRSVRSSDARLRIAVDLDGVLADTMVIFCRILNNRHSANFTAASFVQWNAWEIAHISKDEFFRTLDEAWFEWEKIPPVEEEIGMRVTRICAIGRVDIVTGRSQDTIQAAKSWLEKYEVPYEGFVRTLNTGAKADLSYDVFIDDSADLMSLVAGSSDRWGILYTQPWNKNAKEMESIFRVERWAQIPSLLEQVSVTRR